MHMVSIVEHFPRLETLVLYDMLLVESIDAMTKEGIQTLQLRSPEGLSDVFGVMTLPDLRCLEIIDDDTESSGKTLVIATSDVDAMLPFLASSPVLTEIRFDNLAIRDTDLLRILEETLELKRLAVVECKTVPECFSITDELLERLKEPSVFLTKLEHVELVWAKNNEIEEGKMLDVLEARHSCGVVIGVRGGKELKEETLTKIQSLRARGMVTGPYWVQLSKVL
ncbi:hypothetical protein EV421DRAFT_1903670 [Armillaria borealis]|uniref:Uncharacterized protein n=1 Tax=Armillaria borealis TaxID=47425 RepID=A0AA39MQC2_9AGAR|nr:hypothetical protein EV421DRAFT_1903670 [Armillaria borealis]